MSIKIAQNGESQLFIIETENTSYILGTCDGYLNNLYWGEKVLCPQEINRLRICGNTGANRSERKRVFDEYPAFGGKFYDNESLKVTFADGVRETVIKYDSYVLSDDKKELTIIMKDEVYPLTVSLKYKIYEGLDIIDRCAEIKNEGDDEMTLETFDSANWTLPYNEHYRLTYMASNCLHEYEVKRCDLGLNTVLLQSKSGKSNTGNYPYFAVDDYTATEHKGCVWFGTLQWSGNWQIKAGKDITRNAKITGGVSNFDCDIVLGSKESFKTPIFSGGFTSGGFGAASRQFHNYQRKTSATVFTNKVMPMIYNAWSTFTFNIDQQLLFEQAKRCADLGIELFVIDDGWFGERDDDTKSLGDWFPSPKKFPNGLKPVVDYINSLGMKFGIWIEPEMVNPNSELYRKHPDWVMNYPTRRREEQRNQLTLNFAREDVYQFTENWIDRLLSENNIEFLKFDMNRYFSQAGWPEIEKKRQKSIWIKYVQNFYRLFEFINKKYPNVMLENCAEGGTRADLAMAKWCARNNRSDNQDPIDALQLHEGFTKVLLSKAAGGGCHLHHIPNYVNGRRATYKFMSYVGFNGSFACGLDLRRISEQEYEEIKGYITLYKRFRETVQLGDMYILNSAFDKNGNNVAFQYVSRDRKKSVIFVYANNNGFKNWVPPIFPRGLKEETVYKVDTVGSKWNLNERLSGDTLMKYGITDADGRVPFDDAVYDAFAITIEAD